MVKQYPAGKLASRTFAISMICAVCFIAAVWLYVR
jgi:hypothetical protein